MPERNYEYRNIVIHHKGMDRQVCIVAEHAAVVRYQNGNVELFLFQMDPPTVDVEDPEEQVISDVNASCVGRFMLTFESAVQLSDSLANSIARIREKRAMSGEGEGS